MNWSAVIAGLFGLSFGGLIAGIAGLVIHERREFARQDEREATAAAREEAAVKRHGELMRELATARALTLGAINQRARLEVRAAAVEAAINDHAAHLELLGVKDPARVKVGGEGL